MKVKKFICGLLMLTLLAAQLPAALAAGAPTVSISSGEVTAGESVTLTVSIKDNPGVAACLLYIYYDTSVFEATSSSVRAAGTFQSQGGLIGNTIAAAKKNGRYDGDAGKDGLLALWYNSTGTDVTGDGAMMTVTLTAKATAASGSYSVAVGYSADDTCNEKGKTVALATVGGTVVVAGGAEGTPETPSGGQTESGGTVELPETQTPQFTDVSGHWAEEYITAAAQLGLIEGFPDSTYRPDNTMTRAQCVTILWRACGEPEPSGKASFTDLDPAQSWYWDAVAWAEENGVVNGVGNGKFDPNGTVTREQLATILFRMSGGSSGMETMLSGVYDSQFSDSGKISAWAKKGLYWSIYNVIYCGVDSVSVKTELNPREAADRAQIAVMIVRYLDRE